jgi:hypothetical protein
MQNAREDMWDSRGEEDTSWNSFLAILYRAAEARKWNDAVTSYASPPAVPVFLRYANRECEDMVVFGARLLHQGGAYATCYNLRGLEVWCVGVESI